MYNVRNAQEFTKNHNGISKNLIVFLTRITGLLATQIAKDWEVCSLKWSNLLLFHLNLWFCWCFSLYKRKKLNLRNLAMWFFKKNTLERIFRDPKWVYRLHQIETLLRFLEIPFFLEHYGPLDNTYQEAQNQCLSEDGKYDQRKESQLVELAWHSI